MNIRKICHLAVVIATALWIGCTPKSDEQDHVHTGNNETEEHKESEHETSEHEAHSDDEIIFTPIQAKAAGVEIETVTPSDFAQVVTVSGYVVPTNGGETTISSNMAGIVKIANDHITEGYKVNPNQTIFYISTQLLADGNPVAAAKAELVAAKLEWERAQILIKNHIISQREFEASCLRYETALSTSKSMGNGKDIRPVKTPISGFVQNLLVRNGDYVEAGQALATISQNCKLQLRAELPERYYGMLNDVTNANFRLTYNPDEVYELPKMNGRLLSCGRTVNKGEGFLPITFEFQNIASIIPGSMAEIFLMGRNKPGTISIPITALTEEMGLYYVYIQTSDHSYLKQEIKKGASNGKRVEILSGLKEGDKVASKGAIAIKLAANSGIVPDAHAGHSH